MATTTFENGVYKMIIESAVEMPLYHAGALLLIESLREFRTKLDIVRCRCHKLGNFHRYEFNVSDGRKWKQDLDIVSGVETIQSFNITDGFKESEFALHRIVRQIMIDLVQEYGATDIDFTIK